MSSRVLLAALLALLCVGASVRADSVAVSGTAPTTVPGTVGATTTLSLTACSTSGSTRVTVDLTTRTTAAHWYGKGEADVTSTGCHVVSITVSVSNVPTGSLMLKAWTAPISAFYPGSSPWLAETSEVQIPVSVASTGGGGGTGTPGSGGAYPTSTGVTSNPYNYAQALDYSIRFYEAQRAGRLPANNRIAWRGDSVLSDGADVGLDLSGGWFDAGDLVKFSLPMSYSSHMLSFGVWSFRAGFSSSSTLASALAAIKVSTDYFIASHPSDNEFVAQVGNGQADHALWQRPEDVPASQSRPTLKLTTSKPGSDLAGSAAAALAAMSVIYRSTDNVYADLCLSHAISLFNFGKTHLGRYSDSFPEAGAFYTSTGYDDELTLAAIWLHVATKGSNMGTTSSYLTYAKEKYAAAALGDHSYATSWDDVSQLCSLLLWKLTGGATYASKLETFLNQWLPGGSVPHTPGGLAWRSQWGSLRYATTTALLAFSYSDSIYAAHPTLANSYHSFAVSQAHYALGSTGRSFVVGFGTNPPQRPHHRGASCPNRPAACGWNEYNLNAANPQVLQGALVGGPDSLAEHYEDSRSNYVTNEVTTDYNAGWTGALARLAMEAAGVPPTAGDDQAPGEAQTPVAATTADAGDSSSSSSAMASDSSSSSGGSSALSSSGVNGSSGSQGWASSSTGLSGASTVSVSPLLLGLLAVAALAASMMRL